MPLDSIIDLSISLDAPAVTKAGLGTVMIAGTNATFSDQVKTYSTTADMLTDGFTTSHYEYKAANAIFSQSLRPASVKVGKMAAFTAHTVSVAVTAGGTGDVFGISIHGGTVSQYTQGGSDAAADIVTGLVAQINSDYDDFTATADSTVVKIAADNAGESVTLSLSGTFASGTVATHMVATDFVANAGYQERLATISDADSDWYGLVIEHRDDFHIIEAATYAEANRQLFFAQSNDADIRTSATTDIASRLKSLSRFRTCLLSYTDDAVAAEAAWLGFFLATDPDARTTIAAFKTLSGVSIDSTLTTSTETVMEGKNANYYGSLGGIGATHNGKVAKGEWVDVVLTSDWTYFRLLADLQNLFLKYSNRGIKIPYTDAGIALFKGVTTSRLQKGTDVGHFAADPAFTVTVPARADVTTADAANRLLTYSFQAQLAGAIQSTSIAGTVAVTL